jgi:hypothetical protein
MAKKRKKHKRGLLWSKGNRINYEGRYKWYGRHRRFELVLDIKGPRKKIVAFNSHEHASQSGWVRG